MTKYEINRAVAEKVRGWHRIGRDWYDGVKWTGFNDGPNSSLYWNPAERIDHAWMALEKFYGYILEKVRNSHRCNIQKTASGCWIRATKDSDTAPMAICLAALKAKEGKWNTFHHY